MTQTKDGGPVYPGIRVRDSNGDLRDSVGMTIRQAYKMAALSDLRLVDLVGAGSASSVAQLCGLIADAMLAEDEAHAKKEPDRTSEKSAFETLPDDYERGDY